MKNRKIIIDCDNTFGVAGCDIDDGLAIIYTLGNTGWDLLGINTTFGNNSADVVYPNTLEFVKNIGMPHIPVFRGGTKDGVANTAARFLVKMVNLYPGEVSVLATGSLTNLHCAWKLDNEFYEKVMEISLMGGITKPLEINGRTLNELNFSCDYQAAYNVLTLGKSIKIATGNNCMDALFKKKDFDNKLDKSDNEFIRWLHDSSEYWFEREKNEFGHEGIYKWDVYAAAMLINPHLFRDCPTDISPDMESLKSGCLMGKGKKIKINLPHIINDTEYENHVYEMYDRFSKN